MMGTPDGRFIDIGVQYSMLGEVESEQEIQHKLITMINETLWRNVQIMDNQELSEENTSFIFSLNSTASLPFKPSSANCSSVGKETD